ncbi:MAG: Unknown protein, partial [uncultured Sulfurovum sp.]
MHGENITQDANLNVGGALTLNADANMNQNANTTVTGGDMTVTAGNDFLMADGTSTNVSAGNLNSTSGANTTLQIVDVSGTMDVDATKDITMDKAINVGSTTKMDGLNITQNGDLVSGSDITFIADNDVFMSSGTKTTSSEGGLDIEAGNDTTLETIELATTFIVDSTNNILLNSTVNSGSNATLIGTNVTQEEQITIGGTLDIRVSNDVVQNADMLVENDITIIAGHAMLIKEDTHITSTSGALSIDVQEDLVLQFIDVATTLDVITPKDITMAKAINAGSTTKMDGFNITQNADLVSGSDITFIADNDVFMSSGTKTTSSEGGLDIEAGNDTTLETIELATTFIVDSTNDILLNSTVNSGSNATLTGTNVTQEKKITIGGTLDIRVSNDVVQNADMLVENDITIIAGNAMLIKEDTHITSTSGALSIDVQEDLVLQFIDVATTLDVITPKDITMAKAINAGSNTTFDALNITQNANMNVGGTLRLDADANMNQNANTTVTGGDMTVTAGNDFLMADGTSTNVSAGNFTSTSGANTTLQTVDVSGTMDVDTIKELLLSAEINVGSTTVMHGENITQDGEMTIGGALTLNADANMNQNANTTSVGNMNVTAGNDFLMAAGTSTNVSAGNFTSTSGANTTLQRVDVSGTMDVDATKELLLSAEINVGSTTVMHGANITQDGNLNVGGTLTLNADANMNQNANTTSVGNMNVTAGNDFLMAAGTSTNVSAGNFTSTSGANTTLQRVDVSGTMDVDATKELLLSAEINVGSTTVMHGANITQDGNLNVGGTLTLNADANMNQNANTTSVGNMNVTAGNDFLMAAGTSTNVSAGNFTSTSGANTTLQRVDVSGTMDVDATKELLLSAEINVGSTTVMHGANITQ